MQNDTCYILALIKRDDGERLLLGSGFYEFTKEQKHFNPNLFANDVVELQGADGQLLAGQVRRSTAQSFDGYIGDGTTNKQIVEQKRREFFLFFRKQHHYTVVYIMPDGTAIKRDRGYIVDAPAIQELYQVQPKWHVSLAFEDVNYYSYAEDSQGQEIYAFSADLNLASVLGGGLKWDANGAISTPAGLGNIQILGDTFQQTYEGKNLFNAATAINNHWLSSQNGRLINDSNPNVVSGFIAVQANQPYTISGADSLRIDVWQYTAEDETTGTSRIVLLANQSHTFTPTTDWIRFAVGSGDAISVKNGFMLEAGSTATSFEPFVGGQPSPNPTFPQPIQTVTGEQTITIGGTDYPINLGKNLFDKNNYSAKHIYVGTGGQLASSAGTGTWSVYIKCEPSTTYTVSKTNAGTGQKFCVFNTSEEPASGVMALSFVGTPSGNDTSTSYSITTGATASYLGIYLRNGSQTSLTLEEILDTLQIEKGPQASTYAPYFDPIELCKLGTYQDYIWKDGEDWKVHEGIKKLNLDGSEDWEFQTVTGYSAGRCRLELTDNYTGSGRQPITSNRFRFDDSGQHIDGIGFTSGKWLYLYQGDIASSAPTFKTWLSNNATSAYYRLASATDTTITNATLIAQLNAIEEAMGTDGKPTAIVPTGSNLAAIITGDPNGTGGYEWEASEGGGPSFITVEGVDDALPVWHVVGPATNPTLTNSSNGLSITWNGTVPAGQELIVDMGAQTATMEGANVFQYISGSWLTLSPGTNRIAYTAANTTAGSKIYWNEIVG